MGLNGTNELSLRFNGVHDVERITIVRTCASGEIVDIEIGDGARNNLLGAAFNRFTENGVMHKGDGERSHAGPFSAFLAALLSAFAVSISRAAASRCSVYFT